MQFYVISVSFFNVFIMNNWGKCPQGWGLARFYRPGGGGFELFFCLGVGNSPIKKLPGGMVRLGIDWYIRHICSLARNVLLVYLAAMITTVTMETKNCALTQQREKVFKVHIWHKYSLWQYILMNNFVAMETLLPWQQANCAVTQLYESILSPY